VTTEDLAKLDVRERNYRRVDVTQAITFKGQPHDCVIFTYVPLVEAVERLEKAVANGRPVAIRKTYLSQVQDGFTMINEMDDFSRTTRVPGYEIRDLTFVYEAE